MRGPSPTAQTLKKLGWKPKKGDRVWAQFGTRDWRRAICLEDPPARPQFPLSTIVQIEFHSQQHSIDERNIYPRLKP